MTKEQKIFKKTNCFLIFWVFWPTCQQDATWSICWPTWPSTWNPNPPKIDPRCLPNRSKIDPNIDQNFDQNFDRFLAQLWPNIGPTWPPRPPKGGFYRSPLEVLLALGAFLGPRWAQEPPKTAKRGQMAKMGPKMGPHLGSIFDFFCIFWYILAVFFFYTFF